MTHGDDEAAETDRAPKHAAPESAETPAGASDDAQRTVEMGHGPLEGYERSAEEPWRDRLKDVLGLRTIALLIGCIIVQFGFIGSYVGAFHNPDPHALTVAVVADHGAAPKVAGQLNAQPGDALKAYPYADMDRARDDLRHGKRQAVYVYNVQGSKDTLMLNSAEGSSVTGAMTTIFQQVVAGQNRQLTTQDAVPVQKGDARGLTSFYLVVGWLVGGYLMASLLGIRKGPKARNFRRVLWRMAGCAGYAVFSGIGGALIVGPILDALNGHFWAMAGIGMAVSFAASVFTMGMEGLFGIIGVGVSILIFVVLGNPSAGGAFGYQLLPGFWRAVGPWLPNGAGVDAVRSLIYLDSYHVWAHIGIILGWCVLGVVALLLVSRHTYWGFRRRPVEVPVGMDARS